MKKITPMERSAVRQMRSKPKTTTYTCVSSVVMRSRQAILTQAEDVRV